MLYTLTYLGTIQKPQRFIIRRTTEKPEIIDYLIKVIELDCRDTFVLKLEKLRGNAKKVYRGNPSCLIGILDEQYR